MKRPLTTEFCVSIDICSYDYLLSELSKIIGFQAGGGSHDKGTPRGRRDIWSESILRIDSRLDRSCAIEEHLDDVLAHWDQLGINTKVKQEKDLRFFLNIAIMFYTAYASLEIDCQQLETIARNKMKLQITTYPCDESNE